MLYGYGTEQELTEAGADHIIRTVAELEDYLRNQGENPAKLTWYDRLKGRTEEGKETDMIRFGMIGTGKIAEKFWQANRYGKDFELTAVYYENIGKSKTVWLSEGAAAIF